MDARARDEYYSPVNWFRIYNENRNSLHNIIMYIGGGGRL